MQVGAVLVLGGYVGNEVGQSSTPNDFSQGMPSFFGAPAAMLDLLGEPILYRIIESLRKSGVEPIFLVTDDVFADHEVVRGISRWRVHVRNAPAEELRTAALAAIRTCRESGSRTTIVMQASKYVELDVVEMLRFHSASGQPATFAQDASGPLGIAMVGIECPEQLMVPDQLAPQSFPFDYIHRQYTNRLSTPQDIRRLAQDALLQRCSIRPNGSEVRPGVWVAPSARLHSRVRIVGPAFIGAHARLRSGVVITRCTNIEHHCEVDRGSVVENATMLPHTYLGSSLDIAHSIVSRNLIVNIKQAVEVEIGDRALAGSTSPLPRPASRPLPVRSLPILGRSPWQRLSDALRVFLPERPMPSPVSARSSYDSSEAWPKLAEAPRTSNSRFVRG